MDVSPEYVKMCEKAKEIQLKGDKPRQLEIETRWESGDFYSFNGEDGIFESWAYSEGAIEDEIRSGKCIWLPRQDQLQEMVREQPPCERLFWRFSKWWFSQVVKGEREEDNYMVNNHLNYESFEQLWLAFVMNFKYGKIWDGKEWAIPV